MRKIVMTLLSILFVVFGIYAILTSYHARVGAQPVTVGPAGIQMPGPFVFGTSGPGSLPTCTATANVAAMDGQVAYISNQTSPYPSAAFSIAGITPLATAGTPAMHAMVYCDATQGKWFLVCP